MPTFVATDVHDIQDYASLIFWGHSVCINHILAEWTCLLIVTFFTRITPL